MLPSAVNPEEEEEKTIDIFTIEENQNIKNVEMEWATALKGRLFSNGELP